MQLKKMKKEIENIGYWIGEIQSNERFLQLGEKLGNLSNSRSNGNFIDELIPKSKIETKQNSLSKIYGLSEFPYHTDGAYQKNPPRYIALRYIGKVKSKSPTRIKIFDFELLNAEERYFVKNKIWYVTNGFNRFYSSIWSLSGSKKNQLRYDPGCMKLVDNHKQQIGKWKSILDKFQEEEIYWEENKTLILDNWRVLHSRVTVLLSEKNTRKIQRINIKNND